MDMVNETIDAASNYERAFCAFLQCATAIVGLLSTGFVIIFTFFSNKSLSSFHIICVTRCMTNFTALWIYLGFQLPLTIMGDDVSRWQMANYATTACIANLYTMNQFICVLLAFNRFVATFLYNYYDKICGGKPTGAVLILLLMNQSYRTYVALITPCHLAYNGYYMIWESRPAHVCASLQGHQAQYGIFLLGTLCILLNVPTFIKIVVLYTKEYHSTNDRMKKNLALFVQTILQDALFAIDMVFLMRLSRLFTNPIWLFISMSYTGQLVHTLDSVIMIGFSADMRKAIRGKKKTAGSINNAWS